MRLVTRRKSVHTASEASPGRCWSTWPAIGGAGPADGWPRLALPLVAAAAAGESPANEVWTPERIQKAIAEGIVTVDGPEVIDGKDTVRLTVAAAKAEPGLRMWVDASTYLPVRWVWEQDGARAFAVTWLPPTPENLAQLETEIPAGFTEEPR